MFTDNPVTPIRLEILIETLRMHPRGLSRKEIQRMLQPESLAGDLKSGNPASVTLKAGTELGLIDNPGGSDDITLIADCGKIKDTHGVILEAFDKKVLSSKEVEPYFALFYAYYLGLGKQANAKKNYNNDQWADEFNHMVFGDIPQPNRFNKDKLTGWHRWGAYLGLGWYDPSGAFQANPYERVMRALQRVFGRLNKLAADDFMKNLAGTCPELDGGSLFIEANRQWNREERRCSLGLSHALIELHLDAVIRLDCPADSSGWHLGEAEPPRDDHFVGDRVATIELLKI
jgi:hypothetical protein